MRQCLRSAVVGREGEVSRLAEDENEARLFAEWDFDVVRDLVPGLERTHREHLDPWLTTAQACTYTQRSRSTLWRAARRGELVQGGSRGKRMYRRSALDRWLTLGVLLVLALLFLLLVATELLDLILPAGDFGFPPWLGHPLESIRDFNEAVTDV